MNDKGSAVVTHLLAIWCLTWGVLAGLSIGVDGFFLHPVVAVFAVLACFGLTEVVALRTHRTDAKAAAYDSAETIRYCTMHRHPVDTNCGYPDDTGEVDGFPCGARYGPFEDCSVVTVRIVREVDDA